MTDEKYIWVSDVTEIHDPETGELLSTTSTKPVRVAVERAAYDACIDWIYFMANREKLS